jgi:hypothetical protein
MLDPDPGANILPPKIKSSQLLEVPINPFHMIQITSSYRCLRILQSILFHVFFNQYCTWIQIYECRYLHLGYVCQIKNLPVVARSVRDPDPHPDSLVTSTDPAPAPDPSLFS